ncbi:PREDICTED: FYN-binding protein [Chrysochloris asiatica]|uniref:FYN-binding protein n=1 Tax=Chrysochloris asiatica TaxID=185453 RepID=A0A9B0U767_CHRAS|nr:PREDICTED: FYN-binding protein [Chrysochloris asiatica]
MAKFNTGGNPTEEVNSRPFKVTGQNSPSGIQAKKNLFDNQGNASPPTGPSNVPKFGAPKPPFGVKPHSEEKTDKESKPPFLKPTPGGNQRFGALANTPNRDPEVKVGALKPVTPKTNNFPKEDSKPVFPRPSGNKSSLQSVNQDEVKPPGPKAWSNPPGQENEQKQVFPKLAGVKGKFMSAPQEPDTKPHFPKPAFGQKSSLSTDASQEDESPTKNASPQRGPPTSLGVKSKSGPLKPAREDPENKDPGGDVSSSPFPGVVLKPTANRGVPGLSKNAEEKKEERKIDAAKNVFLSKMNQEEEASPAKFPKVPSKLTMGGPWAQSQEKEKADKSSAIPKKKPLPPLFTLGPPPAKPSRPPNVDLSKYRKNAPGNCTIKSPTSYSTASLPPPPPSHPSSQPPLPACYPTQPPVPSLPPRNIKHTFDLKSSASEENQDGSILSDGTGHIDEEHESEGETYEDMYELHFFLNMYLLKVNSIVYVTKNGYIKTTVVQIDYDSLKRTKPSLCAHPSKPADDDQEVYDDVAEQDDISSHSQSGSGGMFPAPPDDEIYDGIEDDEADSGSMLQVEEEKSNSWSWGILKMLKGKDDKKKSIREKSKVSDSDNNEGSPFPAPPEQLDMGDEVYDDVDSTDYPAPSAETSQGINIGKAKTEEKDPKKLKRQEKDEKDFRKKFKYDGEIRVLYSTKVAASFTSKKWGTRDLQVKPGESLEVIQSTDDTKVLCRNEDGKYGYVLRSFLEDNDGEIYDDIADGCIYDND